MTNLGKLCYVLGIVVAIGSLVRKLVFSFFLSVCIGASGLKAEEMSGSIPDSVDLVAGYRGYLDKYQAISFHFDEVNTQEKISGQVTIARTGIWMQTESRSLVTPANIFFAESIRRKGEYIDVHHTISNNDENYAVYSAISPSGDEYSPHHGNELSLLLGIAMLGKKSNIISVVDALPSHRVKVFTDSLQNKDEYSVQSIRGNYDVKVSISPKYGHALTGYSFSSRTKNNILEGDIPFLDAKFDDFVFVDGIWFPYKYSCTYTFASTKPSDNETDGRVVYCGERKRQWVLKNFSVVDATKENAFKIRSNIPDYTVAYMQDAPQIQYVWVDGKIKPWTDELAIAQIRGVKFIPGVREPCFWLIASGIIMISLALVGKLWKHYQNKKGDKDA
jgi:hypothetical protein